MAHSSPRLLSAVLVAAAISLAASPLSATPTIEVHQAWDSVVVPNGNSFAYPNVAPGVAISRLFRIDNHGTSTLTISNYTSLVSGSGFFQIETPASSVAPGGSTTLRVRFLKSVAGMYFGQVAINNNSSQSPYVIHLAASAGTFAPPAQSLFTLTTAERNVWTPPAWTGYVPPPSCTLTDGWGSNSNLLYLWKSFCFGQAQGGPPDPLAGSSQWYNPTGTGSQNHALLHLGTAALGHALLGNVTQYDQAVDKALQVLALDLQPTGQGHMRHEAVGQYSG